MCACVYIWVCVCACNDSYTQASTHTAIQRVASDAKQQFTTLVSPRTAHTYVLAYRTHVLADTPDTAYLRHATPTYVLPRKTHVHAPAKRMRVHIRVPITDCSCTNELNIS